MSGCGTGRTANRPPGGRSGEQHLGRRRQWAAAAGVAAAKGVHRGAHQPPVVGVTHQMAEIAGHQGGAQRRTAKLQVGDVDQPEVAGLAHHEVAEVQRTEIDPQAVQFAEKPAKPRDPGLAVGLGHQQFAQRMSRQRPVQHRGALQMGDAQQALGNHGGDTQAPQAFGVALEAPGIGTHQGTAEQPLAAKQFQVAAVVEGEQLGAVPVGLQHPRTRGQAPVGGFVQPVKSARPRHSRPSPARHPTKRHSSRFAGPVSATGSPSAPFARVAADARRARAAGAPEPDRGTQV